LPPALGAEIGSQLARIVGRQLRLHQGDKAGLRASFEALGLQLDPRPHGLADRIEKPGIASLKPVEFRVLPHFAQHCAELPVELLVGAEHLVHCGVEILVGTCLLLRWRFRGTQRGERQGQRHEHQCSH
jgi:hypothetical protein